MAGPRAHAQQDDETSPLIAPEDDLVAIEMPQDPPAPPINTLRILQRLEKNHLKELDQLNKNLNWIFLREKIKQRSAPVGSASAALAFIGGMIPLILKYQNALGLEGFVALYAKTLIDGTNATCGEAYKLQRFYDVCTRLWQNAPDIAGQHSCLYDMKEFCVDRKDAITSYQTTLVPGLDQSCDTLYPLTSYCDWRDKIVGYAYDCYQQARLLWQQNPEHCAYANVTAHYQTFMPALSNTTCGKLLPLSVCDWRKYTETAAYYCAGAAEQICAKFPENTKLLTSIYPCSGLVNYSCDVLLSSKGQCQKAASDLCGPYKVEDSFRSMFVLYIILLSFALILSLLAVGCTLKLYRPKEKIYELSGDERPDIERVMNLELEDEEGSHKKLYDLIPPNTDSVADCSTSAILDEIKKEKKQMKEEKRLLSEMRQTAAAGFEYVISHKVKSDKYIPRDVTKRILFFADFTRTDANVTDKNTKPTGCLSFWPFKR